MVAYLYRMPAGIPGMVHRVEHLTVEAQHLDPALPFPSFGVPAKIGTNSLLQPIAAGDAATVIYGLLVRSFPSHSSQDGLGTSTPPTRGVGNVMRRGYMPVKLNGATPATKRGAVYVRVGAAAAGKPIGGIEAAADSTNTVVMANAEFTGPADANGNTEVAYNI